MSNLDLLVILGPTAIGKTEVAVPVAQALGAEIVSCDSMLVYKYMDIGTAKPSAEQRELVRHHLIDVVEPDEPYNVARYIEDANKAIEEIHQRGRLAVIVGGSALYLSALLEGYQLPLAAPNLEVRERLRAEADQRGSAVLHQRLQQVDPEAARRIHPNDLFRLVRALEVYETTRKPISQFWRVERRGLISDNVNVNNDVCVIGLTMQRQALYQRIEERMHQMLKRGLLSEIEGLLRRGYSPHIKPMQALGYREFIPVLLGHCSVDDGFRAYLSHAKAFARRQMTWFRKRGYICWLDLTDRSQSEVVAAILKTAQRARVGL